jgi:transcriptional regulator GlxA family with amidase domain
MTFFHKQILSLSKSVYPTDYLCGQIKQAKSFMEENYSENITLEDIATRAFLSKYHFLRSFKSIYGRTPHQFLTEVRIKKARQLLRDGLPVPTVCFLTGFESIPSFKALFKRHTGDTPAFYQKKLKTNPEISGTTYRFLPFFFNLKKSNI